MGRSEEIEAAALYDALPANEQNEIIAQHPRYCYAKGYMAALSLPGEARTPQVPTPSAADAARERFYEAALYEERVMDERDGDHEGPSMAWYGRHDAAVGERREKYRALLAAEKEARDEG